MRRIISIVLMLCLLVGTALPVSAAAENGQTAAPAQSNATEGGAAVPDTAVNGENAVPLTEEQHQRDLDSLKAMPWAAEVAGSAATAPRTGQIIDDEDTVRSRLATIQASTYPNGSHFEDAGFEGATTCFGFAKKIQYLLFGNIVSWDYNGTANYGLTTVGRVADLSAGSVQGLLSQAKVGDLLQLENGTSSQHSMIFAGHAPGGFIIYDANWDRANTVMIRQVSYGTFAGRGNPHLSLLRNTNYPKKAINDTEAPVISNVQVEATGWGSYRVSCHVSDDVGVQSVRVPVWSDAGGQDDIQWLYAYIKDGVAEVTFYPQEEGLYHIHLYAYDYGGHQSAVAAPDLMVDRNAPVISNARFIKTNGSRFVIGGTVSDSVSGVDRVEVTTQWGGGSVTENAVINGTSFTYSFYFAAHNAGTSNYYIYLEAYDKAGNQTWNWTYDLSQYLTVSVVNYSVTFDSQGGSSVSPVTVQLDYPLTAPADPTRAGYLFMGWYKDKACTQPWRFATDTVEADTTLYAKWAVRGQIGDVLEDGEINAADALEVLRYSVKEITLNNTLLNQADVTDDGDVNAADALDILRYSVKEITAFKKKA